MTHKDEVHDSYSEYFQWVVGTIDMLSDTKLEHANETTSHLASIFDGINWIYEAFQKDPESMTQWKMNLGKLVKYSGQINSFLQVEDITSILYF